MWHNRQTGQPTQFFRFYFIIIVFIFSFWFVSLTIWLDLTGSVVVTVPCVVVFMAVSTGGGGWGTLNCGLINPKAEPLWTGGRTAPPIEGGLNPESLPCCRFRFPAIDEGCGNRIRDWLFKLGMLRRINSWVVAGTANQTKYDPLHQVALQLRTKSIFSLPPVSLSRDCELYGLLAGLEGESDWFSTEFWDLSNVRCPWIPLRKRGKKQVPNQYKKVKLMSLSYSPRVRLLELSSVESKLAFPTIDSLRGMGGPKLTMPSARLIMGDPKLWSTSAGLWNANETRER